MSKLQIVTSLTHEPSRIPLKSSLLEDTIQPDFFVASSVPVGTTLQALPSSAEVISPGNTYIQNSKDSPGDILLTLDGGTTFPFRLKPGAGVPLRMNNEDYREVSTVTVNADDVAGSMAGKYFDLEDRNGDGDTTTDRNVRVWLDMPGRAEVSTIQTVADMADSLNQTYFIIYDNAGSVGVWIDVDNSGSTAPTTGAARNIPVTGVETGDSAANVAAAIQTAIEADGQFLATVSTDTVTVTDAADGDRTDIADGDTGFTFATTVQGVTAPSAPALPVAGGRLVAATIAPDDLAAAIATAIGAAFATDDEITAAVDALGVTLSDNNTGARSPIADGAGGDATGFVFATTDTGSDDVPVLQLKSTSTSWLLYGAAQF